MKRHLLSHRSGIVDEQYLAETSDPSAVRGHRVTVGKDEIEETAGTLLELGDWLISNLPTRTG
jgi:CubicO group peptidase (beta-lactamase class C family)